MQLLAVLLELLQQVGLQVGARADVHDLEDRRQRVVVVDRRVARDQLAEPVEQVLEPQHRADALVERVLVEDQGGAGRKRAARSRRQIGGRADCFIANRGPEARCGHARVAIAMLPERCTSARELGERDALVVDHGVGGGAARARVACWAITARAASSLQPGRAATRSTCVASSQSTTRPRSTRLRQRPDSTSSGTSKTSSGAAAARAACALDLGADQRMEDRLEAALARRRRRTRRRACAARSSAPSASMKSAPKRRAIGVDRGAAGQRSGWRAIGSVSMSDGAEAREHRARPCSCRCRCRR